MVKTIVALMLVILLAFVFVNEDNIKYVTDLATLAELTGRDYTDAEIVDIKVTLIDDVNGTGTELFIFLRETIPFEGNPDYDDGHSLSLFGPYFYEVLQSAGVEREDLISCSNHMKGIDFRYRGGYVSTTQYVYWMPLKDSYDGYSNVLIQTYIPGTKVVIPDKGALLGKH